MNLAKETSQQSMESTPWFLLAACSKVIKERDKEQTELKDLEYSQSNHIAKKKKNGKACSGENKKMQLDNL